MAPPNTLNGIRKQCALFLSLREHRGKLYNADSIATQLSLAADVSNNPQITIDVASLVARAFADDTRAYEYTTPYDDNNYQTQRKGVASSVPRDIVCLRLWGDGLQQSDVLERLRRLGRM